MCTNVEELRIFFENHDSIVFAGCYLSGRIVLVLSGKDAISEIKLRFHGKAQTGWSHKDLGYDISDEDETQDFVADLRRNDFFGEEIYFDEQVSLWGGHPKTIVLHGKGKFSYQFSFQIPSECPSSYESSTNKGFIRYYCQAIIDKPWEKNHLKIQEPFSVISINDINQLSCASVPLSQELEQRTGSCCCLPSGFLTLRISVPKRGYVAGEMINILADIENNTSTSIDKITTSLIQNVKFEAGSKTGLTRIKFKKSVISSVMNRNGVSHHDNREIKTAIQVMPVPPTCCNLTIIQIDYTINLKIEPNILGAGLQIELPIVIGTIPLRNTFREKRIPSVSTCIISAMPGYVKELYPDLREPAYKEPKYGKALVRKNYFDPHRSTNSKEYTPRYPCYSWDDLEIEDSDTEPEEPAEPEFQPRYPSQTQILPTIPEEDAEQNELNVRPYFLKHRKTYSEPFMPHNKQEREPFLGNSPTAHWLQPDEESDIGIEVEIVPENGEYFTPPENLPNEEEFS